MVKLFAPFAVIIIACLVTKWFEDHEEDIDRWKSHRELIKKEMRSHYVRWGVPISNRRHRGCYTSCPMWRGK